MTTWTNGPTARKIDWDEVRAPEAPANSEHVSDFAVKKPDAANDMLVGLRERLIIDDQDPYFVASVEGQLLFSNDKYDNLAGASMGSLPVPSSSGGRCEVSLSIMSVMEEVKALEKQMTYNERLSVAGEDRIYSTKYIPVFDENSAMVALVCIYRDKTAQNTQQSISNAAQQKLEDFARSSSDWFWEVDKNFRITSMSDRFTATTGQLTAMALGKRLDEIGELQVDTLGQVEVYKAIKKRVPFRRQLVAIENKTHEKRMFHLSGVPVFDRVSGDFTGFRGAGMDVTENANESERAVRASAELERAVKRLHKQNKKLQDAQLLADAALSAKDDFLSNMSHELRTPLNAILGFAEAMRNEVSGPLSDNYKDYSNNIVEAGGELLSLVNNILDAGDISDDTIQLEITAFELADILQKGRGDAFRRVNLNGLNLSGLAVDTDLLVKVDFDRTINIFSSILENAVQYTPRGGAIGMDTCVSDNGKQARITIWDTGSGIDADKHEKIFEKLSGGDVDPLQAKTGGAGLSLYNARETARKMGGDISLDATSDDGARFHVYLPLA